MLNISVIIVVKDNPPHLSETITSIESFASEIVIADIGIDQSVRDYIQKNPKVKLVTITQPVPYVELIREGLKNETQGDYVFFLDSDEVVTKDLKNLIEKELEKYDYFLIPRKNIIFGKWITHSRWWPDYQIRLFKKGAVRWPTKIHAQPEASGTAYTVDQKEEFALLHYNYQNLDEFFQKSMRYAKAEANECLTKNTSLSLREACRKGLQEFISRFFAQEGYKDGMHGLILAMLQMFYYIQVYAYYWEGKKYQLTLEPKELAEESQLFFKQGLYETTHWMLQKNLITGARRHLLHVQNKLLHVLKTK